MISLAFPGAGVDCSQDMFDLVSIEIGMWFLVIHLNAFNRRCDVWIQSLIPAELEKGFNYC
ncbi:hypothetical protein GPU95_09620 [Streptococcus thermophilus]|nr:hypothetical protein [Streptococcus thermophilus]